MHSFTTTYYRDFSQTTVGQISPCIVCCLYYNKGSCLSCKILQKVERLSINLVCASLFIWAATWQNQQSDCAPSEDSDQPGHTPSLIRVFAVCLMGTNDRSFLHVHSKDSDLTGWMPRLIWVFAGRTLILLVLSCRSSCLLGLEALKTK